MENAIQQKLNNTLSKWMSKFIWEKSFLSAVGEMVELYNLFAATVLALEMLPTLYLALFYLDSASG